MADRESNAPGAWASRKNLVAGGALLVAVAALTFFVFHQLKYQWTWEGTWARRGMLISGWTLTLAISLAALVLSTVLGVLLTAGQRSGLPAVHAFCRGYVELIRGTPLLTQLLIGYYLVSSAFGLESKVLIGVVLLSCFAGAYIGEILRGGIESIPKTQIEAARAVGFDRRQIYQHVIFPQAIRRVLPAMAGQFANIVKDSSLLMVIGIEEFTQQSKIVAAATYAPLEAYIPLACGYLVLTLPIAYVTHRLEERFRYET